MADESDAVLSRRGGPRPGDPGWPQYVMDNMPINDTFQIRLCEPAAPDVYSMLMDITPGIFNHVGIPHGAATVGLMDICGGFASGELIGRYGPTTDLHVRYLTGPKGNTLRADGRILRANRTFSVVDLRVVDAEERLVASGDMTVFSPVREDKPAAS